MELLTVGSVRSEYTPVEIDTSVTYLPKGKGATLGVEGIEYGRWIRKLRSFSWGVAHKGILFICTAPSRFVILPHFLTNSGRTVVQKGRRKDLKVDEILNAHSNTGEDCVLQWDRRNACEYALHGELWWPVKYKRHLKNNEVSLVEIRDLYWGRTFLNRGDFKLPRNNSLFILKCTFKGKWP